MIFKGFLSKFFPMQVTAEEVNEVKKKEDNFVESLNDDNKLLLRAYMKLNLEYQKLLSKSSSDYDEILIYEQFTSELNVIFHRMLKQLDLRDKKITQITAECDKLKSIIDEEIPSDVEFGEFQSHQIEEVPKEMKIVKVVTEESKRIQKEMQTSAESLYKTIHESKKNYEETLDELFDETNEKLKKFKTPNDTEE